MTALHPNCSNSASTLFKSLYVENCDFFFGKTLYDQGLNSFTSTTNKSFQLAQYFNKFMEKVNILCPVNTKKRTKYNFFCLSVNTYFSYVYSLYPPPPIFPTISHQTFQTTNLNTTEGKHKHTMSLACSTLLYSTKTVQKAPRLQLKRQKKCLKRHIQSKAGRLLKAYIHQGLHMINMTGVKIEKRNRRSEKSPASGGSSRAEVL